MGRRMNSLRVKKRSTQQFLARDQNSRRILEMNDEYYADLTRQQQEDMRSMGILDENYRFIGTEGYKGRYDSTQ